MAHLDDLEADDSSFDTMEDAASAISQIRNGTLEDEDGNIIDESDDEEEELDNGEIDDNEEELEEAEEEAETPIDAPASLTADEKKQFAQLPPEGQALLRLVESRRTTEVQKGLETARAAQREAESNAAVKVAEAEKQKAEQLFALANAYAPKMPDPVLAQHNPAEYIAQKALYDADIAQHGNIVQQIQQMYSGAEEQLSKAEQEAINAEWKMVIDDLPEARDEAQYRTLVTDLRLVAEAVGYPADRLANASPLDIRAMKIAKGWKDKADKLDALEKGKMQRVRAGKTAKANAAQPTGSVKRANYSKSRERLRQTGDVRDAAALIAQLR